MKEKSDVYRGLKDPEFLVVTGQAKVTLLRYRVWQKTDGICGLCGLPVEFAKSHVDHVVPRSLGGPCHFDNFQIAHGNCNASKGNLGHNHRPKKIPVELFLTKSDKTLIAALADRYDMSKASLVELAVREYAQRQGVNIYAESEPSNDR